MARPRKYTARTLTRACRKYISSISYLETVTELYDTGEVNKKGLPVMRSRPVTGEDGCEMKRRVYISAPSLAGLALYLKVDRSTLRNYIERGKDEDAGEDERACAGAIEWVRLLEEQYNIELLGTSRARGAMFNLNCNFGWSETQKIVSSVGGVEQYLSKLDGGSNDDESGAPYEY